MSERDKLIQEWIGAKRLLDAAKKIETELRQQVIEQCFSGHKPEGTENFELGNNYKLKCVFKQNYSVDKTELDNVLSEIERTEEGRFWSQLIIKYKPELIVPEYKKLPEALQKVVNRCLTIKPASPSLEFVEPKEKK